MKHLKTFESFGEPEQDQNWKVDIDNGSAISYWEFKSDAIGDGILEYLNGQCGYQLFEDDYDLREKAYEMEDMEFSDFEDELSKLITKTNDYAEEFGIVKNIKLICQDGTEEDFNEEQ
jgi:hypothetical protein